MRRVQRVAASLAATVALSALLGCEISPVVTADESFLGPYHDCKQAAEDYCEHVVVAAARDMDTCVADHTFQCVSGSSN